MPLVSGTFGAVMRSSFSSLFACLGHLGTSIYFPPSHLLSSQVHSGSKEKRVGAGNTSHVGHVAHLYSESVYRTPAVHPLQLYKQNQRNFQAGHQVNIVVSSWKSWTEKTISALSVSDWQLQFNFIIKFMDCLICVTYSFTWSVMEQPLLRQPDFPLKSSKDDSAPKLLFYSRNIDQK